MKKSFAWKKSMGIAHWAHFLFMGPLENKLIILINLCKKIFETYPDSILRQRWAFRDK